MREKPTGKSWTFNLLSDLPEAPIIGAVHMEEMLPYFFGINPCSRIQVHEQGIPDVERLTPEKNPTISIISKGRLLLVVEGCCRIVPNC